MPDLARALRSRKDQGGGAFVPYMTGGLAGVDAELLRGLEDAGADAIEVGIPFSDPVMDGPVIQEASRRALEDGATPSSVLGIVKEAGLGIPVAVMTYANPVWHAGHASFLGACVDAGASGVIMPDLPVDEAADWLTACGEASVSPVFLAAPDTPDTRLRAIADASRGFVYCVATYGVTGARDRLSETASDLVRRLRPATDLPLLLGVGISEPGQAAQACAVADGVVVGSALVQPLLERDRPGMLGLAEAFAIAVHGA
jgi:tryptophan synthase alpha chain